MPGSRSLAGFNLLPHIILLQRRGSADAGLGGLTSRNLSPGIIQDFGKLRIFQAAAARIPSVRLLVVTRSPFLSATAISSEGALASAAWTMAKTSRAVGVGAKVRRAARTVASVDGESCARRTAAGSYLRR